MFWSVVAGLRYIYVIGTIANYQKMSRFYFGTRVNRNSAKTSSKLTIDDLGWVDEEPNVSEIPRNNSSEGIEIHYGSSKSSSPCRECRRCMNCNRQCVDSTAVTCISQAWLERWAGMQYIQGGTWAEKEQRKHFFCTPDCQWSWMFREQQRARMPAYVPDQRVRA
uniref:Uncharacterized protein n=1 Tax=Cyanoptyche gloeocystis TaxID=77922 RepID=A0A7S2JKE4_9EUKA